MIECTCKDFVTAHGVGNCKKEPLGKETCYVERPSNCVDLKNSTTNPGEQYSSVACKQGN